MQLREFLKSNNLQMAQFAEQIGTTGPTVCRIAGGQVPRVGLMIKIYEATGGQVTPNDLVGIGVNDQQPPNCASDYQQQKLNEGDTL